MSEKATVIKYNDIYVYEKLAELADSINKVVPNLSFKTDDECMDRWSCDKALYPSGVAQRFRVFHNADPNNSIGLIDIQSWNSKTPKFGIQNINIADGRTTWGEEGQFKTSIHAKNIVRVAKKVFKPYTFTQIARRTHRQFANKVDLIRNIQQNEIGNNTCHQFELFKDDLLALHEQGHTFINPHITKMIQYAIDNKEKIDKYLNYNPNYYFVLAQNGVVQYAMGDISKPISYHTPPSFQDPKTVASKDELPEDIRGKLFVLDITEGKDFVEDIGLKENDGAYWIIA